MIKLNPKRLKPHKSKKKYNMFQNIWRAIRLNFIKLLRAPGGVKKISLGFAIGFGLEMIVISTASLVYLVFYPIVRLSGGSLPAAIVGNVVGKLTFLPIVLMPFAKQVGAWIYPSHYPVHVRGGRLHEHSFMELFHGNWSVFRDLLHGGLHILIGMSIFGVVLGIISYFVIQVLYNRSLHKRLEKRKLRHGAAFSAARLLKNG